MEEPYKKGCLAIAGQQFKLPPEGSFIEFEKYNTKLDCPFVIYGDFECLAVTSSDGIKGTYQEHKPCGYKTVICWMWWIELTKHPHLICIGMRIVWINL